MLLKNKCFTVIIRHQKSKRLLHCFDKDLIQSHSAELQSFFIAACATVSVQVTTGEQAEVVH